GRSSASRPATATATNGTCAKAAAATSSTIRRTTRCWRNWDDRPPGVRPHYSDRLLERGQVRLGERVAVLEAGVGAGHGGVVACLGADLVAGAAVVDDVGP